MCGIILGAAILGVIIMVMEGGEFPGWGAMIGSALAAVIPMRLLVILLVPSMGIVGLLLAAVVSAACAGAAISATCGMSLKRSVIAASIYLGINLAMLFALQALLT